MIRLLLVGLLAIASTLGGSLAASFILGEQGHSTKKEDAPALELIKLERASVPVIRAGKIEGYVIVEASVGASVNDAKSSKALLTAYANEAVFRAVFEDKDLDFSAIKPIEINVLSERVVKFANERIGRPAIKQAILGNLNYVSKIEARAPGRQ